MVRPLVDINISRSECTNKLQVTDEAGKVLDILNETAKCYEGEDSGLGKMGECSKNNAKGYASLTGQPGKKITTNKRIISTK